MMINKIMNASHITIGSHIGENTHHHDHGKNPHNFAIKNIPVTYIKLTR